MSLSLGDGNWQYTRQEGVHTVSGWGRVMVGLFFYSLVRM